MSSQKAFRKNAAGFLLIVVCCLSLYVALPAGTAGNDGIMTLKIIPTIIRDFQLSASPSTVSLLQNQEAVFKVTISAIGFPEHVTLSALDCVPAPASCNFSPSSGNTPYGATLTVKLTGPWVDYEAGAVSITIQGTSSSGQTHTTSVNIDVNKPG